MNFKFSLIILLILFPLSFLSSCSDSADPTPPDAPAAEGFRLLARAESLSPATRAPLIDPDDYHESEKINSWIVIFYRHTDEANLTGIIEEIIRSTTSASPAEEFYFSPRIPDGTYDIAAFANIDESTLSGIDNLNLSLTEGASVNLSTLRELSISLPNHPGTPGTYLVPMSGYRQNVKIADNSEAGTDYNGTPNVIEVIRLYAKIEIQLKNTTDLPLTIDDLNFGRVNKGTVRLFPFYSNLGADGKPSPEPPTILQTLTDGKVSADSFEVLTDVVKSTSLQPDETTKAVFYVRESDAKTLMENGRFYVHMKFTRDGKSAEKHYADLADSFQWIQRNDHILVTVPIGKVTWDWEVFFYPPIGGYPALMEEQGYTYTFSTPGKFSIRPIVKDGGEIIPSENLDFKAALSGDPIFKSPLPTIRNGEIIGEIDTTPGTATLSCTLKIQTSDGTTEERTQTLTIVRQ